jgi:hypothetical protein
MRGFIAAQTGDRDTALSTIQKIEESKVGALGFNGIGFIYYALEDLDSYFLYMNQALDLHALDIAHVMYSPLFAKGRTSPRWPQWWKTQRRCSHPAKSHCVCTANGAHIENHELNHRTNSDTS